ncbi:hypothetical protein FD724_06780 [Nostoc sp. C057]|uniref:hypothetical protein n=1 Tax=Nostoc sp. C057 TaxID=2576903 RepID=UPI0015C32A51|nr:hypothetical protein [Nostoc sp. C057]QLE47843.1 hypothetical protein FD724_06780 [Nostoc sp. C057]
MLGSLSFCTNASASSASGFWFSRGATALDNALDELLRDCSNLPVRSNFGYKGQVLLPDSSKLTLFAF